MQWLYFSAKKNLLHSSGCLEEELVECVENPCATATCSVEGAVCVSDNCLECHARWFLGFEEVTDICTAGVSLIRVSANIQCEMAKPRTHRPCEF